MHMLILWPLPVAWVTHWQVNGCLFMCNNVCSLSKQAGALLCFALLFILKTVMWDKCLLEKHSVVPKKNCSYIWTLPFHSLGSLLFFVTTAFSFIHESFYWSLHLSTHQPVDLSTLFVFLVIPLVRVLTAKFQLLMIFFSFLHQYLLLPCFIPTS